MREFKRQSRVLLIDDNADHLRGVKELITLESSYEVVGTTTSANIGINLAKKYRPDIILMDVNMPEKDGLQALQDIEKLDLGIKVICLSGYDDADLIFRAMKLGANHPMGPLQLGDTSNAHSKKKQLLQKKIFLHT